MVSALISRSVILVFGLLYPAYSSYKAVKTKNVKEYVKWMMYWIVFAFFTCIETFADIFVAWIPFYFEIKIIFVLWLLSPATKGASIIYRKFIHPQLAKREKDIDAYISKATDQGYTAIVNLGSKGINYATNVVLSTAVKGQAKIADHLRKSYSLNDLSGDPDEQPVHVKDTDSENEDELDNRIIEENYQREMGEKSMETEDSKKPRRRKTKDPGLEKLEEEQEPEKSTSRRSSSRTTYSSKELDSSSRFGASSYSRSYSSPMGSSGGYRSSVLERASSFTYGSPLSRSSRSSSASNLDTSGTWRARAYQWK